MERHAVRMMTSSAGEAPRELRGVGAAERAELDERAGEEEAVREANLDAARERGDARAVRGEVGEEVGDDRRGRDGGLEHADERVAVDRLDHLGLRSRRAMTERRGGERVADG